MNVSLTLQTGQREVVFLACGYQARINYRRTAPPLPGPCGAGGRGVPAAVGRQGACGRAVPAAVPGREDSALPGAAKLQCIGALHDGAAASTKTARLCAAR